MDKNKLSYIKKIQKFTAARFSAAESFTLYYLAYLYLAEIQYLKFLISDFHAVFVAWGACIIFYAIFRRRRNIFKVENFKYLLLILFSHFLSIVFNYQFNVENQLKSFVLNSLVLLLVYPSACKIIKKARNYEAVYYYIRPVYLLHFLASLTSLVLFFGNFSLTSYQGSKALHFGIIMSTYEANSHTMLLYGVFSDPNHAAGFALAFLMLALFMFFYVKNKRSKIFHGLNCFLQFIFIVLANSRATFLGFFIIILLASLYFALLQFRKKTRLLRAIASSLAILILPLSIYVTAYRSIGKAGLSYHHFANERFRNFSTEISKHKNLSSKHGAEKDEVILSKGNFSKNSKRFLLIKESIEIIKKRPIFGIGVDNQAAYAKLYFPKQSEGQVGKISYEKSYLRQGSSPHNSYIEIVLYFGFFGLLAWLSLIINILYNFGKRLKKYHLGNFGLLTLACLIALANTSFFLSTAFVGATFIYASLAFVAGILSAGLPYGLRKAYLRDKAEARTKVHEEVTSPRGTY